MNSDMILELVEPVERLAAAGMLAERTHILSRTFLQFRMLILIKWSKLQKILQGVLFFEEFRRGLKNLYEIYKRLPS